MKKYAELTCSDAIVMYDIEMQKVVELWGISCFVLY